MNIFVYRDMFFEMWEEPQGRGRLRNEQGETIHEWIWYDRPTLLGLRKMADDYVEKCVEQAIRAGGDVECATCKRPYREHPEFRGAFFMEHAYLTRLCNGDLVKL